MKIVVDTNVILSAFLTEGITRKVFDLCIDNDDIYLSEWILSELTAKLKNKFCAPEIEIKNLLRFLKQICKIIEPKGLLPEISRDKDDNQVLLLAESIMADLLLTGDKDLLDIKKHKNTKIINPRTYYELYK